MVEKLILDSLIDPAQNQNDLNINNEENPDTSVIFQNTSPILDNQYISDPSDTSVLAKTSHTAIPNKSTFDMSDEEWDAFTTQFEDMPGFTEDDKTSLLDSLNLLAPPINTNTIPEFRGRPGYDNRPKQTKPVSIDEPPEEYDFLGSTIENVIAEEENFWIV